MNILSSLLLMFLFVLARIDAYEEYRGYDIFTFIIRTGGPKKKSTPLTIDSFVLNKILSGLPCILKVLKQFQTSTI